MLGSCGNIKREELAGASMPSNSYCRAGQGGSLAPSLPFTF